MLFIISKRSLNVFLLFYLRTIKDLKYFLDKIFNLLIILIFFVFSGNFSTILNSI